MKKFFFFVILALGLTSCDEISDAVNSVRLPSEAKPSGDFFLGQFPEESNAAHAHKFSTNDPKAPFATIEFFADGHYVTTNAAATRATEADVYGTYTVDDNFHYTLSNGDVIDATNLDDHCTVTYTPKNGDPISVDVISHKPLDSNADKCFCRTWSVEDSKFWLSVNGFLALYRDYYMEGRVLQHKDNFTSGFIGDFYKGELLTEKTWPEQITISPYGTYFVKFANGNTLLQKWSWAAKDQGKIKTESGEEFNIADLFKNHDVTIRFNDNKLTLYTEYKVQATSINNASTFVPTGSR